MYYAWGEVEEKSDYSWTTYKWCNGSSDTLTKYCTDSNFGIVDNLTQLDLEDDVASVVLGGDWRMPTFAEVEELLDNCDWEWTTVDGVEGCLVSGNGNSIFLPAAGNRLYDEEEARDQGCLGGYWASTLNTDSDFDPTSAKGFYIQKDEDEWDYGRDRVGRHNGLTIRAVQK